MREMKDSGIEWIGEIPKDWTVLPIKYVFNINRGRVISVLNLVENGKYPVYSAQTENDGCFGYLNTYDFEGPAITWTTDGAKAGSVFYRDGRYNCTNVCGILQLKENYNDVNLYFATYAIAVVAQQNKRYDINGFKIMSNEMARIKFAIPNIVEQQQIADFLDTQCSEIDATAEDIQKEISLLEDYKKSVITEAVTKGLNPDAEMKDSGVKWLPKIPKHWKVIPSKYLFANSDIRRQTGDEQLTASQKYGIITQKDYTAKENAQIVLATQGLEKWKHVEPNDFIISLRSFQGGLEMSEITGCITWHYVVLKAQKEVCHKYYKWLFKSARYINALQGTCNFIRDGQDLRFSNFALVPLFELPLAEQQQIADYLDTKCSEIDAIIADKKRQRGILADYKKSLIYEYVTGKKEVPVHE